MIKKIHYIIIAVVSAIVITFSSTSCNKIETPKTEAESALIIYSAGFNNLNPYLAKNLTSLKTGYIPSYNDNKMLFVILHTADKGYYQNEGPKLIRIWRNKAGEIVESVLLTTDSKTYASDVQTARSMLTYIRDNFKIEKYGLIFSSHSTGYLPPLYGTNESKFETEFTALSESQSEKNASKRSMGNDFSYSEEEKNKEMDIIDFVNQMPIKFEYILMDTCFMGGIEVAYQFRDICHYIGFSQTEVLADGLDYSIMTDVLLNRESPDLTAISKAYINLYMNQSDAMQSATWSLIDCTKLDPLAKECKILFNKYRAEIASLQKSKVQRYYREHLTPVYHWFYDLEDIIIQAGANEEELNMLHNALNNCIIYKGATPYFFKGHISEFEIKHHSGLSMMLPSDAGNYLKAYYTHLDWNQDTHLIDFSIN